MAVVDVSDEVLLARMLDFEDVLVERKTSGDHKDWLKTAVAFANTAQEGVPCILYIGVRDDGIIEDGLNLDSLQKKLSEKLSAAYPPLPVMMRVLRSGGKQILAVIVWGSSVRPHFAGHAYVRSGSKTIVADEREYARFIAQRSSVVRELLKYKGQPVDVYNITTTFHHNTNQTHFGLWSGNPMIEDCNQFYVTLRVGNEFRSVPLGRIELSFNHERTTLRLDIHQAATPRH